MSKRLKNFLITLILTISFGAFADPILDYQNPKDIFSVANLYDWKYLLHYENNKSIMVDRSFFLSPNGMNNPSDELEKTIQEYIKPTFTGENDVICRFPARVSFIKKHFNLPKRKNEPKCSAYKEYRKKVKADDVFVVFAGENNTAPSSMMGHLFLKLSGNVNGITREHSFSFLATFEQNVSVLTYAKMLLNIIDGYYMLSPYQSSVDTYIYGEKRSLWEFKLILNDEEKEKLLQHLWELKEKKLTYDFITHNCGNATIKLLEIANTNIIEDSTKPWTTPTEHLKKLIDNNRVKNISLLPSEDYKKKIKKTGEIKDITDTYPSSKISLGYQHNLNNYITLNFRPVYMDISEPNHLYYDDLETRLFSFDFKYGLKEKNIILDKIDILKMKSIIDFLTDYTYSKDFKISFENKLGEEKTHIRPVVEFGMGTGISILNNTKMYVLPKVGYRYDHFHNLYLTPEIGVISNIGKKSKTIISYEHYIDFKENNRGYNKKISTSFVYKLNKIYSLELNFNRYFETKNKNSNEFWIRAGISF